jgi:hypothetical protein
LEELVIARRAAPLTEKEGKRKWKARPFSAAVKHQRRFAPCGTHWITASPRNDEAMGIHTA